MMTPLEAAAEAAIPRERGSVTPTPGDYETARRVTTAFLEAAAEDEDATLSAGLAASRAEDAWGSAPNPEDQGKAAILALKETINGP